MKIEVRVSRMNKKYIEHKHPKKLRLRRYNLFAMLYFAQLKFRGGQNKAVNGSKLNLTDVIYIETSLSQWLNQRLKKIANICVDTAFNSIIRDFFYIEYFTYMDLRLLKKELLQEDSQLIKELALEYMQKLNLSDDDILLETLLRNYRRYRLNPSLDIYELIAKMNDR